MLAIAGAMALLLGGVVNLRSDCLRGIAEAARNRGAHGARCAAAGSDANLCSVTEYASRRLAGNLRFDRRDVCNAAHDGVALSGEAD